MIKSMTGFGSAEGEVGGAHVSVEIRSVNHRFFNPSVKLPSELTKWESEVRETLRKGITRGHVTLTARVDRHAAQSAKIDEARFGAYVDQIRSLQQRFGLSDQLDVSAVLRLPDVVSSDDDGREGTAAEIVAVVDRALSALDAMRAAEGARLSSYLVQRIAERAPMRLVEQRDRLRAAIQELADGVALDEQRVAQEIAILADRLDV